MEQATGYGMEERHSPQQAFTQKMALVGYRSVLFFIKGDEGVKECPLDMSLIQRKHSSVSHTPHYFTSYTGVIPHRCTRSVRFGYRVREPRILRVSDRKYWHFVATTLEEFYLYLWWPKRILAGEEHRPGLTIDGPTLLRGVAIGQHLSIGILA